MNARPSRTLHTLGPSTFEPLPSAPDHCSLQWLATSLHDIATFSRSLMLSKHESTFSEETQCSTLRHHSRRTPTFAPVVDDFKCMKRLVSKDLSAASYLAHFDKLLSMRHIFQR